MSERFYIPEPIAIESQTIEGAEAHHLLHVMRAKVGDALTLFDGTGWEFPAVVEAVSRNHITCAITSKVWSDRELPFVLSCAAALPKGDRQKWMIEKLVEIGVTRFVPLMTKRTVTKPTTKSLEKLRRTAIEASKQCRRNRIMEITEPVTWAQLLESDGDIVATLSNAFCPHSEIQATKDLYPTSFWLAHPGGNPLTSKITSSNNVERNTKKGAILFAIGPEGGFTDEEVFQAKICKVNSWQTLGLGERILRTETAAIALAVTFSV